MLPLEPDLPAFFMTVGVRAAIALAPPAGEAGATLGGTPSSAGAEILLQGGEAQALTPAEVGVPSSAGLAVRASNLNL
jgi:hypothetical protein